MTNVTPPVQPAAKANTSPAVGAPQQPAPLPPAPEGFINVVVDGTVVHVKKGSTVMQACTAAAKEIPHFCYHERLSIAGNCRMCLVEVEGMPKPIASCHWPAAEGMRVRTTGKITEEARKGTMELLLINHPLDCPICDQGGECALQDQALGYGSDRSHYHEFKRAVDDKFIGSKIKTVMTRCIHCTRCVRFATEVAGVEEFGATFRGENMQVGTYVEQALQSELAGNMIDLCPVGALTSAPYAYTARPWELVRTHSVDVLDAVGTPITVDNRQGEVMRTLPREDDAINEEWMTDAARFSYDALKHNRLTTPLVGGKPTGWPEAFTALKKIFSKSDAKNTAGILGALQSAEDAFSFKMFLNTVLGTQSYDSRPAGSSLSTHYTFATPLKEVDAADAILLIGCNPRFEAPLLNVRLRRAALKRRVPVAAVGEVMNLTYPYQQLENSTETLQQLAKGKHPFAATLKNAKAPIVIVSASVFTRPDAESILALASKLGTVNVLADTAGRVTALDMGILPGSKGRTTATILKAWKEGTITTLIVHGEDTVGAEELKGGKGKLIYVGTHHSAIAKLADVVLPASAWSEKSGLYANLEGRVQLADAAVKAPLNAKEDWKIYRALSEELGNTLPFNTLGQLRALIATAHPSYQPENLGKIVRKAPIGLRITDYDFSKKPILTPGGDYYLRLEYLRQSATMHKCQAEQGQAQLGKSVPMGFMPVAGQGPSAKPSAPKGSMV